MSRDPQYWNKPSSKKPAGVGWLEYIERKFPWVQAIAIPQIAWIWITLQVMGYIAIQKSPEWAYLLSLDPEAVRQGQVWRLITFLSIPVSDHIVWLFFSCWFTYFVLQIIESQWGAFRTTLYVMTSIAITAIYSLITGYPVSSVVHVETTFFLAAAALFPDIEVSFLLLMPVKLKFLALLTLLMTTIEIFRTDFWGRGLILAIYSNFLIFFGPALLKWARTTWSNSRRKKRFTDQR